MVAELWSEGPLGWLLAVTVWTGAVFVVVRLAEAGLGRVLSARVRGGLYALVLVRLSLPLSYATPVGLGGDATQAEAVGVVASADAGAAAAVAIPWLSRGGDDPPDVSAAGWTSTSDASTSTSMATSMATSGSGDASVAGAGVAGSGRGAWSWALVVWLLGVAALALRAGLRHRAMRRLIAQGQAAPGSTSSRARVLVHPEAGPLAYGVFDPVVLLPRAMSSSLDEEARRCVLAHEHAHHQGHDPLVVALLGAVVTLAWPVVPVWLAARRVRALLEHAADDRALRVGQTPSRRAYGRALVELASRSSRPSRAVSTTVAPALSAYRDLRRRVIAIATPVRTPKPVQGLVAAGVAVGVLACGAAGMPGGESRALEVPRAASCDELADTATQRHDAWAKKGSPAPGTAVTTAYDDYLASCDVHEAYPDMLYYSGEAYWAIATAEHHAGDQEPASDHFAEAQTRFDAAIDAGSEFTEDAAWGQHLAALNAHQWEPPPGEDDGTSTASSDLAFVPYEGDDEAVVESWDRYVSVVGSPAAASAEHVERVARLMMRHNDFERARPLLRALLTEHADTDAAVYGAEAGVDVATIAWVQAQGDEPRRAKARALVDLLDRVEASPVWARDDVARLHEATATLRVGVAYDTARRDLARGQRDGDEAAFQACIDGIEAVLQADDVGRDPDSGAGTPPARARLQALADRCRAQQ